MSSDTKAETAVTPAAVVQSGRSRVFEQLRPFAYTVATVIATAVVLGYMKVRMPAAIPAIPEITSQPRPRLTSGCDGSARPFTGAPMPSRSGDSQ